MSDRRASAGGGAMTGSNVVRDQLCDLGKLIHLIATLNFPDETASTRLSQIAILTPIEPERQSGANQTAPSMSQLPEDVAAISVFCHLLSKFEFISRTLTG